MNHIKIEFTNERIVPAQPYPCGQCENAAHERHRPFQTPKWLCPGRH